VLDVEAEPDPVVRAAFDALPRSRRGKPAATGDDVYTAAKKRIADCYDTHDEVIVSFSGGKDSTVLLNLAAEVAAETGRLPLRVWCFDEEAVPYSFEEYVRRLTERADLDLSWFCLPIEHRNACHPDHPAWWPWAPEARDLWCRALPPEAISEEQSPPDWWPIVAPEARPSIPVASSVYAATRPGTVAMLLGLRAQESLRRRGIILSHSGPDAYMTRRTADGAKNLVMAYPIYDWTSEDVWTGIATRGWDYCAYYDHMEMLGVGRDTQRLGPPFGEEPLIRLWTYRELDPALWDRLSLRVPGARTAALHSRNTLYGGGGGSGGGAQKDDAETWPEAINRMLLVHTPDIAAVTAKRIAMFVRSHYKKTSDPILDVPHPVSAISWPWLARIAMRGDLKTRRDPPFTSDYEAFAKRHAAYTEALARHREAAHADR
jgi:predicted phosphoadenosine phosphosulfate sulfurtransferase